jgi:serine/threonine-protein kinase
VNAERWRRLQEIFLQAAELPTGERTAFLDRECAGDTDVRQRVESMLVHDDDGIDDMSGPVADAARAVFVAPEPDRGSQIGPYRLDREIGRGGMGTVHLAYRADDEYRKQVAIKVMRAGSGDPEMLRRFRAERQILASLEHPFIARLIDGGTTDDGSPYVVMDYVEGEPIDAYCDRVEMSIGDRLQIFRKVCAAVHYAHQNLIVHRDLKPANILVTSDGNPRLLDFGIAKLLQPESFSESVAVTSTEMRLLTPEYASPEQVKGESVTTATDVYALGVLLHHLLSGGMPYRLKTRTAGELERVICDQEPVRPSAAVSRGAGDAGASEESETARVRATTPDKLGRRLAGDLDLITLRALNKEPERRYASAEQLSNDVRRHLDGHPIEARKDTWRYRTGKFVQRNPWGAAAAGVILVLILGSSVGFFLQARKIAGERDRALAAEAAARLEATTAVRVTDFLVQLFESSTPAQAQGREITAREVLDRGARRVRGELNEERDVQARLMTAMSDAYTSLGHYQDALPLAEEALELRREKYGEDHPEYARALAGLGGVQMMLAEYEAADTQFARALELRRKHLGPAHEDIVNSLNLIGNLREKQGRYDEAIVFLSESVTKARELYGDRHETVATSLSNLGQALMMAGDYEEAEAVHREALAIRRELLGDLHPALAGSLNNLNHLLARVGRYDEARPFAEEVLALNKTLWGEDSINYAVALSGVSLTLKGLGRAAEAEPMERQALETLTTHLGEEHPLRLVTVNNLANLHHDQGELREAEALHRQALEIHTRIGGRRHPHTANSLANLSMLLWDMDDFDGAEPLMREVLEIDRETLGEDHSYVAMDMNNLAVLLRDRGDAADLEEAEQLFRRSIEMAEKALGENAGDVGVFRGEYGILLARTGRVDAGEEQVRAAIRIFEQAFGPDHFQHDQGKSMLGECYLARGRYDEAKPLLVDGYQALGEKLGPLSGPTRRAQKRVARLHEASGQ